MALSKREGGKGELEKDKNQRIHLHAQNKSHMEDVKKGGGGEKKAGIGKKNDRLRKCISST